ncbi:MAG: tyrosine-type recombinase/integrase [Alistipes sp.]|nr:tyrosine-type recombinase/integrase [Alistipes sp.]
MARTTFSITYYCRQSKTNKQGVAPLEMCININQNRLFINLPTKLSPKAFNRKRKPAEIDDLLNLYRSKVSNIISQLLIEGIPITANCIREYMRTGGTKSITIEQLCDEYLRIIKKRVGKTMVPQVYKRYELVRDFLFEILTPTKEVSTVNNADMVNIYHILKNRFMPSTSAGYMVKIKTIFHYAIDNNWIKINPFNGIKVDRGTPNVEFLTVDELDKIKHLDLSDYERLDRVRDLLLFQASVGTAYCDLVNFDVSRIIELEGVFVYNGDRQKTGIQFTTVILPWGLKILDKYNGRLPIISNQKYNSYLKEIQRLAGIETVITSHLLRKTYAHTLLNNGVNISVVAKCLGHTNTIITQKTYARPVDTFVASEVGKMLKQWEKE